jgi:hypothetical protein
VFACAFLVAGRISDAVYRKLYLVWHVLESEGGQLGACVLICLLLGMGKAA